VLVLRHWHLKHLLVLPICVEYLLLVGVRHHWTILLEKEILFRRIFVQVLPLVLLQHGLRHICTSSFLSEQELCMGTALSLIDKFGVHFYKSISLIFQSASFELLFSCCLGVLELLFGKLTGIWALWCRSFSNRNSLYICLQSIVQTNVCEPFVQFFIRNMSCFGYDHSSLLFDSVYFRSIFESFLSHLHESLLLGCVRISFFSSSFSLGRRPRHEHVTFKFSLILDHFDFIFWSQILRVTVFSRYGIRSPLSVIMFQSSLNFYTIYVFALFSFRMIKGHLFVEACVCIVYHRSLHINQLGVGQALSLVESTLYHVIFPLSRGFRLGIKFIVTGDLTAFAA